MKTFEQLVVLLNQCAATCDHCAAACLQETNTHHLVHCIRADIVCASVCRTTALLLEHGMSASMALKLCAKVCRDCAKECSKHVHAHCKACAQVCEACVEACKLYAA